MKKITFDQACLLIGRKTVTVYNQNHEAIVSWVQFFGSEGYYTDSKNLVLLSPKSTEAVTA